MSQEKKIECVNRFIVLANEMTAEGAIPPAVVSSGLMMACAVYSTYVVIKIMIFL